MKRGLLFTLTVVALLVMLMFYGGWFMHGD